ncbi:fascin domain-containing protein [Romboutsia sp.]|uniref:fascin domain-containing protein n=1 Tax=Romboutsia sp. TaxID=1965302 RepID=UPI003F3A81A8
MNRRYDNKKEQRIPGGVIVFPPYGPGGPGPIFPPWINPKPPKPPGPGPFPPVPPLPPSPGEVKLKVKIKSVYENKFIVVGESGYLYAAEDKYSKNSIFKLIIDGNNVKIKYGEDSFVRLDNRDFLIANSNKKQATIFKIYKVDKEEYVLQAPNGYFVRVREKDNLLVAKAENAGEKTRFKFKIVE